MSSWEVLVTRRLPEVGIEKIRNSCRVRFWEDDLVIPVETLHKMAAGVDGIVCLLSDPMDGTLMDIAGPSLKVISTMAVGFDNIDVEEATRRGIAVGNTPGVLTDSTADFTWALILAVGRRVVEGDRLVREGKWRGWGPIQFLGADFIGRTIGIVGMGRIGAAVARRAVGFGMEVIYHNRRQLPADEESAIPAKYVSLDELLERSDFVSLHCPLNEESRHLIGANELDRMKTSAYLINIARGPVVDEAALVEALGNKVIAGAGLDVYEKEPELFPGLTELDNAVLAPHMGSASIETRNKMADMAAENLLAGLKGEKLPWGVNSM